MRNEEEVKHNYRVFRLGKAQKEDDRENDGKKKKWPAYCTGSFEKKLVSAVESLRA